MSVTATPIATPSGVISRADLKTFLRITATTYDDQLTLVVAGANEAVDRWLGFSVASSTRTDVLLSGDGSQYLYTGLMPLTAVSDVRVSAYKTGGMDSGRFDDTTLWAVDGDYRIDRVVEDKTNRGLLIAETHWPKGQSNIKLGSVTVGYTTIPSDIQVAAFQIAAAVWKASKTGGVIASEKIGDYSYVLAATDQGLGSARSLLKNYRRIVI